MSVNHNPPDQLPSIHNLEPLEKGGEVARQGFIYQDHVGAGFCLDMVELDELLQVWFETHDDITLIWANANNTIKVEFVQVKHVDRSSRWSVAALTAREKETIGKEKDTKLPKVGTSLLEKSLNNSRCLEETSFRIVTSVDVDQDLTVLTLVREGHQRKLNLAESNALATRIIARLGAISSPDGTTIEEWTDRCFWDKRPETNELIELQNRFRLEAIAKQLRQVLYSDQRDELYQRLLALVSRAAVAKFDTEPEAKKILQDQMRRWLDEKLLEVRQSGAGAQTLQGKMRRAGIPVDVIGTAVDLRVAYLTKRLDHDYVSSSSFKDAEQEVTSTLQHELALLDSGEFSDNGIEFHARCLKELKRLSQTPTFIRDSVTLPFLQGYMYERTNRCVHRYDRAQP